MEDSFFGLHDDRNVIPLERGLHDATLQPPRQESQQLLRSPSGPRSHLEARLRRTASSALGDASAAADVNEVASEPGGRAGVRHKLTIISNRLPTSAFRNPSTGEWNLTVSAGGLVSALLGVSQHDARWVGWPGQYIPDGPDKDALEEALLTQTPTCIPVWMDKDTLDLHYNGFCNSVLWQLFHYVPVHTDFKLSETHTLQQQWASYLRANHMFAEVMLREYQEGDIVWIQDYHLMLLPEFLKARAPNMKVGFFLHTPFPSSEIYRTLPYREELLRGILKADLIGFHTYDYARHFISSCTRILGLEGTPYGVEENGVLTRVAAFPIGIDPSRFAKALHKPEVTAHIKSLRARYAGRKVMLGVDRLDMIKGIPQKLLAFEKFLEEHPEWVERVLLVQIAVPSRVDVPEYQHLRSTVHEIVGRINGKYGTLTHVPIHHLDRSMTFYELCALYSVTDVALVTSLRDGMNLVSYEYVVCQKDTAGVLVLSEFAGAAQSLGAGSILVNPWNINDMAQAIWEALKMSPEERYERWRSNYMHVTIHTAQTWADNFISELNDTCVKSELRNSKQPPSVPLHSVTATYKESQKRLIMLGYNATLTSEGPKSARGQFDQLKGNARVNSAVMRAIKTLSADPNNVVIICSGSQKEKLSTVFGDLNVWLTAENGVYLRPPRSLWEQFHIEESGEEWLCLYENMNFSWVGSVESVFNYFCERTPRSFVESRATSVVWNYKYSDVEFGKSQAQDMLQHLLTGPISNSAVDVVRGSRSVEVRMVGVNKGISTARMVEAMARLLGTQFVQFDFVLCIGHFMSRDEAIFQYFEGKNVTDHRSSKQVGPRVEVERQRDGQTNPETLLVPAAERLKRPMRRSGSLLSKFAADAPEAGDVLSDGTETHSDRLAFRRSSSHSSASLSPAQPATVANGSAEPSPRRSASQLATSAGLSDALLKPDRSWHSVARGHSPPSRRPSDVLSCDGSLGRRSMFELRGRQVSRSEAAGGAWQEGDWRLRESAAGRSATRDGDDDAPATPSVASTMLQQQLFPPRHLFSITVGRACSRARYSVSGPKEVGNILQSIIREVEPRVSRASGSRAYSGGDDYPTCADLDGLSCVSETVYGSMTDLSSLPFADLEPLMSRRPSESAACERLARSSGQAMHPGAASSAPRNVTDGRRLSQSAGTLGRSPSDTLEGLPEVGREAPPMVRRRSDSRDLDRHLPHAQSLASMALDGLTTVTEDSPIAVLSQPHLAAKQPSYQVPPPGQMTTVFDSVGRPMPVAPHVARHNGVRGSSPSNAVRHMPSCDPGMFGPIHEGGGAELFEHSYGMPGYDRGRTSLPTSAPQSYMAQLIESRSETDLSALTHQHQGPHRSRGQISLDLERGHALRNERSSPGSFLRRSPWPQHTAVRANGRASQSQPTADVEGVSNRSSMMEPSHPSLSQWQWFSDVQEPEGTLPQRELTKSISLRGRQAPGDGDGRTDPSARLSSWPVRLASEEADAGGPSLPEGLSRVREVESGSESGGDR